MNGSKDIIEDPIFLEEQLFEAKQALFVAKSVREIRFLQNKINYLRQKMKEVNGR